MLFIIHVFLLILYPNYVIPPTIIYITYQLYRYITIITSDELHEKINNDEDEERISKNYFRYSNFFRLALYQAILNIKKNKNVTDESKLDSSDCILFLELQDIKIIDKNIISKQFKKLAKKYHPDANVDLNKEEQEKCSINFKKLVHCKEKLLKGLL